MILDLTVGQVAGLIALGLFLVQIWNKIALPFILAGLLHDRETAATLTVASRALQHSYWPDLLRSDAAHTTGVRKPVALLNLATTLLILLTGIAGILTPFGLRDSITEGRARSDVSFAYSPDASSFGAATLPRNSAQAFSRTCSSGHGLLQGPAVCPFSNNTVVKSENSLGANYTMPDGYSSAVPQILRDIFGSGTNGRTTVANFFDIEYRQLTKKGNKNVDNGMIWTGTYRQIETMVMDDRVRVVEGLVVDAENGGLGFRNHTLPDSSNTRGGVGASWKEDLLFVEPQASCVDMNLTLDYTVDFNGSMASTGAGISSIVLTDRGGFVNINKTYPTWDRDRAQEHPEDLRARAYKGAWLNTVWTMLRFNVTNSNINGTNAFSFLDSYVGKTFPLSSKSIYNKLNSIAVSEHMGTYILDSSLSLSNASSSTVTSANFSSLSILCRGQGNSDVANMSNIYVLCGLWRGAPSRTDGGHPLLWESGSKWSSKLFYCAAAARASVKTVDFRLNNTLTGGHTALAGLQVTDIQEKTYKSKNDAPLWGMEDSGMSLDQLEPVWGLVDSRYEAQPLPNISTIRAPSFYLPGYSGTEASGLGGNTLYNLPGAQFYRLAMASVFGSSYGVGASLSTSALGSSGPSIDYSGASNVALLQRWQNLSTDTSGVQTMIKLLWTDFAAPAVVGTKGALGQRNLGNSNEQVTISVKPLVRRVTYIYPFGIPAFLLLLLVILISAIALLVAIGGKSSISTVEKRLRQSYSGRICTRYLYPSEHEESMKSRKWMTTHGRREVDLTGGHGAETVGLIEEKPKRSHDDV